MVRSENGNVPLAQLYFRERSRRFSAEQLETLFERIRDEAVERAREVYGPRFPVDKINEGHGPSFAAHVLVEEGSVKVIATVFGIGFTILSGVSQVYGMIAKWSEFKAGLRELCEDARRFDIAVCDTLLKLVDGSKEDVVVQKRTGLPGSLLRLIKKVDALETEAPNLRPQELDHRLGEIKQDLLRLSKKLAPQDVEVLKQLVTGRLPLERKREALIPMIPIAGLRPEGPRLVTTGTLFDTSKYDLSSKPAKSKKPKRFKRQQFIVVQPAYAVRYTYEAQKSGPPAVVTVRNRDPSKN